MARYTGLPAYAELACRSNFSFLTGASHPEELVARAQALRYAALAITDECSFAGVVRAHVEAERLGMPLVIGTTMQLAPADEVPTPAPGPRLLMLAQNRRGYANLAHWITVARGRAAKGAYHALMSDLEGRVPDAPMLAGLPGCLVLLVAQPFPALPAPAALFDTLLAQATWLARWVDAARCAIALPLHLHPQQAALVDAVRRVAALTGLRIVAVGDVLMHVRSRKPLLDVLTATRLGQPVAACGHALAANAEQHLRSRVRLASLYRPEWLAATVELAATCTFSLRELRYEYPQEIVPAGYTPTSWLRCLTEEGLLRRYPVPAVVPDAVRATVERELAMIQHLAYEPFFLTVAEVVQWARQQHILCQGRGSAANSVVCFALGITEVRPGQMELLFERFVSVERNEPPDIDVDFEHQRREEVIQHIYQKYGRHRAALAAVVISYRPRSALRDVGRALGFDAARVAAVCKGQQWFDGRSAMHERLRESGFDPASPLCRLWMELTQQLIGFPRHLSQHPGGFVIARDQISRLVPVENAAMDKRSVIQWDKDDLDALGLLKVDVLALGMLSAIRRALVFVGRKLGVGDGFSMQQVPQGDDATYDMLCRADSVGVFQVESRAQMSMLPRLQPRSYYDLVVQVAIVRPGPIQGDMVHPYLRRRAGLEPTVYPGPEIKQALERTRGVPIFQEQVMQIAMLAADFSGGEADQLRRAMAAWKRKGGLGPFRDRLIEPMVAKGYERAFAERLFSQMEGFGEYGFPESHAASFALLVYISAWIKCHHPDAFLAALLNSQPMGFYAPAQLVRDAREHGVTVLPVDVSHSVWGTELEGEGTALRAVRLGLSRISGFTAAAAERIVAARQQAPLDSVEDLARRAVLDAHHLQCLAQAGALVALAGHRRQAAWAVAGIDTRAPPVLRQSRTREGQVELPAPTPAQDLLADYRRTGLTLGPHPLALLRERLAALRVQPAAVLRGYPSGRLARASGLVTHRQRPGTAKGVVFVTLEDETGAVNVIVWPQVVEAQRRPLLASRLLTVYGVWQVQGEVRHLVARTLVDHSAWLGTLNNRSRDFH